MEQQTETAAPVDTNELTAAVEQLKAKLRETEARETEAKRLREVAEQLTRQRDQEIRAARQSEAEARSYASRTEHDAVSHAIAAAQTEATSIQEQLAHAIANADGPKAADLQRRLARTEAQLMVLEDGKAALEQKQKQQPKQDYRSQPISQPEQRPSDPFEAMIAKLGPEQQTWLRQHKDKGYVTSNGASPKLMAAHYAALDKGLREGSSQYLDHLDESLGHKQKEETMEEEHEAPVEVESVKKKADKRPIAAAPVSRDTGGGIKTPKGRYKLSSAQLDAAGRMGMTNEEYIQYALEAKQNPKWSNLINLG